jgi:signal peptidase II
VSSPEADVPSSDIPEGPAPAWPGGSAKPPLSGSPGDNVEQHLADSGVDAPRRRGLVWVTLAVAAIVIVIDQLTKVWALATLQPRIAAGEGPIQVVGTWFQLTFVENTGAGFGIGAGFTWLFAIIAVVVAIVIIRTATRLVSVAWAIALGGLLGGAVGNLIDRLIRPPGFGEEYAGPGQGYVVDFLQLPNWPVFNVADMAIVGSAILMVILTVRGVELSGKSSGAAESPAGAAAQD